MTIEEAEKVAFAFRMKGTAEYLVYETQKRVDEAREELAILEERLAKDQAKLADAIAVIEEGRFPQQVCQEQ